MYGLRTRHGKTIKNNSQITSYMILDSLINSLIQDGFLDLANQVKLLKEEFLMAPCTVYCETCSVVFYKGLGFGVLEASAVIWDFRYLAFRHCWDNPEHKVVVSLPLLAQKTQGKHSGFFEYSEIVNTLREDLRAKGDVHGWRACDENWNPTVDRVLCSNCKTEFNNIREACYCCSGAKPFLPFQELENFKIQ